MSQLCINIKKIKTYKMKKSNLIIAICLFFTSATFSQVKFAAKAGMNMSWILVSNSEDEPSGSETCKSNHLPKIGIQLGGVAYYTISEKLNLQGELLFSQLGDYVKSECSVSTSGFSIESTGKNKIRLNYLNVPVLINYKINDSKLMPYVNGGIGLSLFVGGKIKDYSKIVTKETGEPDDIEEETETYKYESGDINRIDLSLLIGGGIHLTEKIAIETRLGYSLTKISSEDEAGRNFNLALAGIYKF